MPSATVERGCANWTIRCFDSLPLMERMRADWVALERSAADPLTYFQSYDWCHGWCTHYASGGRGRGAAIRVFAAYHDGRLVMVWPLMLTGSQRTIRRLVTLTEPHGQYSNALIDPVVRSSGKAVDLLKHCWLAIRNRHEADAVILDGVPERALPQQLTATSDIVAAPAGTSASMDLAAFGGCYEKYRASLTAKTRRSRNKRRNRLAALGALEYRVHAGGTPEYSALVRTGIGMKRDWLKATGRATGALNLPHVTDFLGRLPNNAAGDSGAVAAAVMLGGRPIAVEIGFLHHRRFYSYLGSFDWQLRDYSPGKLQLEEAIQWCLRRDVQTYDLLGAPSTYKDHWCDVATPLMVYRSAETLRGRAYLGLWSDNLRPALKSAFTRMPLGLRTRLIPLVEGQTTAARALSGK